MAMMPTIARITKPPNSKPEPVLLASGDRMDQPTFHRLYSQTSKDFRAQLIEGVVHVASPATIHHGGPHTSFCGWLCVYCSRTLGTRTFTNTTIKIDDENEFQPDGMLLILPEYGGQITIDETGCYWQGTPEFALEISYTTSETDRTAKRMVYEANGVLEYLNIHVETRQIEWWQRRGSQFVALKPDRAGRFKSKAFPGLWLDAATAFDDTPTRMFVTLEAGLASPDHARFVAKLARQRDAAR
jgi:Putative restriction endonuclease